MISPKQLAQLTTTVKSTKLATPYMLTDTNIIREQCQIFKRVFPTVKLYYAVKCFNDDQVIQSLDEYVDGYDVASVAEIQQLIRLGVNSEKMAFSNPVKSEQEIKQASQLGVTSFAYQSKAEVLKIKKYAPKASVYLRIKVMDNTSAIAFSSKFGCEPDEALELLSFADHHGLQCLGLTFHVGSQATLPEVWDKAILRCAHIMRDAKAKHGIELTLVNLGGGFPVCYSETDPSIEEVGEVVAAALRKPEFAKHKAELIAEPGRFIVADSSVIVTTVIGREERGGINWLFLDVGSFQAFIEIFEFHNFPYPVYSLRHLQSKNDSKAMQSYVLTGPSCDSYDTMTLSIELPEGIKVGDKLLITMAGAYTIVYGSAFNGFAIPQRVFID